MKSEFDVFWEQAQSHFIDTIPPFESCGNCGKDIVSVWEHMGELLLLHPDKSMCWDLVLNV